MNPSFELLKPSIVSSKAILYQDVELLPSFGEVDLVVEVVRVADVDEGQVLQDQSDVGDARRPAMGQEHKFLVYSRLRKCL